MTKENVFVERESAPLELPAVHVKEDLWKVCGDFMGWSLTENSSPSLSTMGEGRLGWQEPEEGIKLTF